MEATRLIMKSAILTLTVLLTLLSLGGSRPSLSRPVFEGSVSPSDWNTEAQVNPQQLITVRLHNQTAKTLVYALANDNSQTLLPGKTGEFLVRVGRFEGDTSTILINTPEYTYPLIYNFKVTSKNTLTVQIQPTTASNPSQERTIYIDERGRVYSF